MSRGRRVRVGELSSAHDDGMPDLLRDYGSHKSTRAELEPPDCCSWGWPMSGDPSEIDALTPQ
jgi:hypothetical protein